MMYAKLKMDEVSDDMFQQATNWATEWDDKALKRVTFLDATGRRCVLSYESYVGMTVKVEQLPTSWRVVIREDDQVRVLGHGFTQAKAKRELDAWGLKLLSVTGLAIEEYEVASCE